MKTHVFIRSAETAPPATWLHPLVRKGYSATSSPAGLGRRYAIEGRAKGEFTQDRVGEIAASVPALMAVDLVEVGAARYGGVA